MRLLMKPKTRTETPTAQELAHKFSQLLWNDLQDMNTGVNLMDEVVKRNKAETDPIICHTHDFCDSNQTMLDAMESFGMEFDIHDEKQHRLIVEAWNIAKGSGFACG